MGKRAKKRGPGRPQLPPDVRRVIVSVRIPPATVEALDGLAEKAGETRSATVERLVEDATRRV